MCPPGKCTLWGFISALGNVWNKICVAMYEDWIQVLWNLQVSHFLNLPVPDVVASEVYITFP